MRLLTQAAAKVSEESQGKRLLILAAGSRGDVQPLVVLAAACMKAGLEVFAVTLSHHSSFFEDFGVQVMACDEYEDTFNAVAPVALPAKKPELKKQLSRQGSTVAAGGAVTRDAQATIEEASSRVLGPAVVQSMVDFGSDFRPDLVISSLPLMPMCHALAEHFGVPAMECSVWPLVPTAEQSSPYAESAGVPGCLHYAMWLRFQKQVLQNYLEMQLPTLQTALKTSSTPCGWSSLRVHLLDTMQPVAPGLVAVSPSVVALPRDAPAEMQGAKLCGYLLVSRQEQLTKADHLFGCRAALRAFLAESAEPPLYFGWGPVVSGSPQAMARAAVGAALACGRRAVVLCGGADLGPGLVQGPGDEDLQAYVASGKVIFARSAPHEFLFPQCAAVVHHGGVGTTACSMRSGVPTIVTPCCAEQVAQARLVSNLGVGVGLDASSKLTAELLASTIKRCISDTAMQAKCKELSTTLQKEEAAKIAVDHIDKFLTEQVATGKWKAAQERRQREKQALLGGSCGCFAWCGKILGVSSRSNYAPGGAKR